MKILVAALLYARMRLSCYSYIFFLPRHYIVVGSFNLKKKLLLLLMSNVIATVEWYDRRNTAPTRREATSATLRFTKAEHEHSLLRDTQFPSLPFCPSDHWISILLTFIHSRLSFTPLLHTSQTYSPDPRSLIFSCSPPNHPVKCVVSHGCHCSFNISTTLPPTYPLVLSPRKMVSNTTTLPTLLLSSKSRPSTIANTDPSHSIMELLCF